MNIINLTKLMLCIPHECYTNKDKNSTGYVDPDRVVENYRKYSANKNHFYYVSVSKEPEEFDLDELNIKVKTA